MPKVRTLKDSEIRMLTAIYRAGNMVTTQNRPKGVSPQDLTRLFGAKLVVRTSVPNPKKGPAKEIFAHSVIAEYLPQLGVIEERSSAASTPTATPAPQPTQITREVLEAEVRAATERLEAARRKLQELTVSQVVPELVKLMGDFSPDDFMLLMDLAAKRDPNFSRNLDHWLKSKDRKEPEIGSIRAAAAEVHRTALEGRA